MTELNEVKIRNCEKFRDDQGPTQENQGGAGWVSAVTWQQEKTGQIKVTLCMHFSDIKNGGIVDRTRKT